MSTTKHSHKDIVNYNPIKGYEILNRIQPKYFQTQYPYNIWDSNKLTFTQNKIELLVRKSETLKSPNSKKLKKQSSMTKSNSTTKKGGVDISNKTSGKIIIYG